MRAFSYHCRNSSLETGRDRTRFPGALPGLESEARFFLALKSCIADWYQFANLAFSTGRWRADVGRRGRGEHAEQRQLSWSKPPTLRPFRKTSPRGSIETAGMPCLCRADCPRARSRLRVLSPRNLKWPGVCMKLNEMRPLHSDIKLML